MGFKEEFLKFKQPSPAREDFIYQNIIQRISKDDLIKSMKPIEVKRPDGNILSYKVMPDYLSIEGFRVPMSAATAQKVANHFGLMLPTAKMSQEIYDNADVKITAKPLSGTGTIVDGRKLSGKDVVNMGVGYADFAINYNDVINQQLKEKGAKPGQIVSGFAKNILAPLPGKEDMVHYYGYHTQHGKAIQGGIGLTPHSAKPKDSHAENASFGLFILPESGVLKSPTGQILSDNISLKDEYGGSEYKVDNKPPSSPKATPKAKTSPLAQSTPAPKPTPKLEEVPAQESTGVASNMPEISPSKFNESMNKVDEIVRMISANAKYRRKKIANRINKLFKL